MASENGNPAEGITLLREIKQAPHRYGFFQAVRRINCGFPDKALTGKAFRPSEDPVRFAETPYTSFAPSTLNAVDFSGPKGTARISQRFLGLFGPDGPLPIHLTEYARWRMRHHQDHTLAAFGDMFHHRIVSLYYRAWAQAQPTVQHDRPDQDRFSLYVASLAGFGMPALKGMDAMPQALKLHFTGHLASLPRHATGLASILESYFGVKAKIREFIAHWLDIPRSDRFRLGKGAGTGQLGESTVLGGRVWQRQDKFQICLGPLSLEDYEGFLPSGRHFAAMTAMVRNYLGIELLWETQLLLKGSEKPVTCLGKQGALGWTSWLQSEEKREVIGDLVLQAAEYRY